MGLLLEMAAAAPGSEFAIGQRLALLPYAESWYGAGSSYGSEIIVGGGPTSARLLSPEFRNEKGSRPRLAALSNGHRQISSAFGLKESLPGSNVELPLSYKFLEQTGSSGLGGGGFGAGIPSQTAVGGPPGLRIIPVITISERYDSNVFYAPNLPGLRREDYVTSATPQIFVQDTGRLITTTFNAGATAEYYVVHPRLSYVGFNTSGTMVLSSLLGRFVPNASLYVLGAYRYTPNPPSFLVGSQQVQQDQVIGQEITNQLPLSDVYVRGLQANRVNQTSYTASVAGAYPLTSVIDVQGFYGFSAVHFGTPILAGSSTGFNPVISDSKTHTGIVGPVYKLSDQNSLNLVYRYSKSIYGGGAGEFETHSATLGWQRIASPQFITRVYAGPSLIRQQAGVVATTTTTGGDQIAYNGGASLTWSVRRTQVSINYSAGVYPGYVNGAVPLLSHNVGLFSSHRLDDDLTVAGGVNYGRNDVVGPQSDPTQSLSFESYNTFETLSYRISSSMFVSLSHTFGYFKGNYGGGTNGSSSDSIYRNAVTISLAKAWY